MSGQLDFLFINVIRFGKYIFAFVFVDNVKNAFFNGFIRVLIVKIAT